MYFLFMVLKNFFFIKIIDLWTYDMKSFNSDLPFVVANHEGERWFLLLKLSPPHFYSFHHHNLMKQTMEPSSSSYLEQLMLNSLSFLHMRLHVVAVFPHLKTHQFMVQTKSSFDSVWFLGEHKRN